MGAVDTTVLACGLTRRLLRPKNNNARRSPQLFPNNEFDALVLRSGPPSAHRQKRRGDDAGLLNAGGDNDPQAEARQDE